MLEVVWCVTSGIMDCLTDLGLLKLDLSWCNMHSELEGFHKIYILP